MNDATSENAFTHRELALVAGSQKKLVWTFVASIFLVQLQLWGLLVLPLWGYFTFQLAKALKIKYPIIWAVFAVIPLINLIVFLVINQKAVNLLKQHNIKVGFLGVSSTTIRELEYSRK